MSRQSVRDIKTFANITDRRRARSPHGAYLELASLALHKHRLLREHQSAEARNAEIETQIREMDRKSGVLRTFVEDPRSFAAATLQKPHSGTDQALDSAASDPPGTAMREQELSY